MIVQRAETDALWVLSKVIFLALFLALLYLCEVYYRVDMIMCKCRPSSPCVDLSLATLLMRFSIWITLPSLSTTILLRGRGKEGGKGGILVEIGPSSVSI